MNKVELEFQDLNNKLEKLFERLSKFNNEQLNQKVVDGKWSINENIYHLILQQLDIYLCYKYIFFYLSTKENLFFRIRFFFDIMAMYVNLYT